MVWIVGAVCLILFGAGIGVIGLSLGMLGYAIVGGIMVLCGIFQLVSFSSEFSLLGGENRLGSDLGLLCRRAKPAGLRTKTPRGVAASAWSGDSVTLLRSVISKRFL